MTAPELRAVTISVDNPSAAVVTNRNAATLAHFDDRVAYFAVTVSVRSLVLLTRATITAVRSVPALLL